VSCLLFATWPTWITGIPISFFPSQIFVLLCLSRHPPLFVTRVTCLSGSFAYPSARLSSLSELPDPQILLLNWVVWLSSFSGLPDASLSELPDPRVPLLIWTTRLSSLSVVLLLIRMTWPSSSSRLPYPGYPVLSFLAYLGHPSHVGAASSEPQHIVGRHLPSSTPNAPSSRVSFL
jgi:hypothetical protein